MYKNVQLQTLRVRNHLVSVGVDGIQLKRVVQA
jgi:hypothetical protein